MFLTVVFYFLLSFFSVYGLISFILYFRTLFSDMGIMKGKTVFNVVALKNEEEKAEGILKSLLFKAIASDSGISDTRVIAVDLGSTDNTAQIVKKMEKSYPGISLMNINELSENIEKSILYT